MKKAATVFVVVALMAFMAVDARHAIVKRADITQTLCNTLVNLVGLVGMLVGVTLTTVTGLLGGLLTGLNLDCVNTILGPLIQQQLMPCISNALVGATGAGSLLCTVAGSLDKLLGCLTSGLNLICVTGALPPLSSVLNASSILLVLTNLLLTLLVCVTSVANAIVALVKSTTGMLDSCKILP